MCHRLAEMGVLWMDERTPEEEAAKPRGLRSQLTLAWTRLPSPDPPRSAD